jgi:hypothetical protein
MFGLFTRPSRIRKPLARRTTSLFLERLEDRLSPSGSGPVSGGGGTTPPSETITLSVTYDPNKQATFSGQLTNQNGPVPNQTINLTGVANGTTTTNAQGVFNVTLSIPQLGTEYAASADGQSNTAQITLVGGSPVISSFTAVAVGGGLWTFQGNVSGAPTQGEAINFGGITPLQGQSTGVNSDGTFSFTCMVPTGEGGWATAQAIDWWGDTSETASDFVNC